MEETMWGIDLGGTKVEGIILQGDKEPKTLIRTRVDTEASKGYDHVIGQIDKLVNKMKTESGLIPKRIGFGTPGILDPISHTLKNSNTTILNHQPLKKDLEERLQYRSSWPMMQTVLRWPRTWGSKKKGSPRKSSIWNYHGHRCRRRNGYR